MKEWIQIRSWHIVRTWTRMPGRATTLCGRTANGMDPSATRSDFPPDEKTCESCLRLDRVPVGEASQ